MTEDIDNSKERKSARSDERQSDPAFGAQDRPEVNAADGNEQHQIDSDVREPSPEAHEPDVSTHRGIVLARHGVQIDESLPRAVVVLRDDGGTGFEVEVDRGLPAWNDNRNNQAALFGNPAD